MDRREKIGYVLTMFGGICWAFSGACGQFLFQNRGISSDWLVSVRLTLAGLTLTVYSLLRGRGNVLSIFRSAKGVAGIGVFALFGMAMCQYSFFRSIELSNAATATTLQYTGLVLVMLWLALWDKRLPHRSEILAVACAMAGAFLLATHGDPSQIVLSEKALFWCMMSAISFAVYSVQPREMIVQYGTMPITGIGMLMGGIVLCAIFKPWHVVGKWDIVTILGLLYIITFGTICAFCCYLEGVRRIGAAKGSILAAIEPVVSAVLSIVWLGVPLGGMDMGGIVLIIASMVLLAKDKGKESDKNIEKA